MNKTVATYDYITVKEVGASSTGKTKIYHVTGSKMSHLGEIRWYPQWRQYTFMPKPHTVFSAGCLNDIAVFIKGLKDG